jgi:uncharacterized membrane protein YeiH
MIDVLTSTGVTFGGWQFVGDDTFVDLLAASTNALNGALLARRPDHYRDFTFVGIILMAFFGGIGGGVARDVMLGQIPSALTNPAYIALCLLFGIIGYFLAYTRGQLFREGLFQFMTSFALPWYAIIGAAKAVDAGLPVLGALVIAVVGPTAGRYLIDISSGVPPKQFVRGEWFVVTAILTGLIYIACTALGLGFWAATLIAFAIGFVFRVLALYRGWEEPLPKSPKGTRIHSDSRPLLGRKLHHKSQEELRMLGLLPDQDVDYGSGSKP